MAIGSLGKQAKVILEWINRRSRNILIGTGGERMVSSTDYLVLYSDRMITCLNERETCRLWTSLRVRGFSLLSPLPVL